MKIRTLLIFVVICFSLVSMIVFTSYTSEKINETAETQYSNMILEMSDKQSHNVKLYFEYLSRKFAQIPNDIYIKKYIDSLSKELTEEEEKAQQDEISEALINYLEDQGIASLTIFNDDNEIKIATDLEIKEFFNSMLFQKLEDNKFVVFTGNTDETTSDYKFVVKSKISNGYNLLAIFDSMQIKSIFTHASFPVNGRIILIDPNNQLLDTTYVGNLAEINIPEYSEYKKQIVELGFKEGSEVFSYEIGKNKRIAYLTNVNETDWKLGVIGEADKAYTYSHDVSANLINCVVFLGIVLVVLGIVFIVLFTKPLYVIEETLVKIKHGDYEARINVNTNNEYGEIAQAFNELLDDVIVSEARYRTIIEMSDNIIFEWNFENNNVFFSNNFNKKFSYRAPSDSFEDSFLLKCMVHPDDAKRYKEDLEKLSKGQVFRQNEYRWKNIYSDYIWILMRTAVLKNQEGEIIKVVGVIVDIDRAKKSEKILTTRASYDALTTLYNRETVESLISNEIELITARKNEFAILFIDVDDFKQYNDNYSHATGDQVLQFVASSINQIISQFGIAGRYGGDEFVVCIRNSETNDPVHAAQDILAKLKDGFVCDVGEPLMVEVSIGIAVIRDATKRVDEIIGMADDAMYKIKKNGKASYGFITE